jgi:hypothetical protein
VVLPPALRAATALLLGLALTVACGPPPQVEPTPAGPLPGPGSPGLPNTPSPALPGDTSPPPTPDDEAVSCDGQPTADQVLDVLHDAGLLNDGIEASVVEGPLCAEDWQYAVVSVPDRDPLQVITSGEPDTLTLVTAGTDVCTVEVRVHAPRGIRAVASCVG